MENFYKTKKMSQFSDEEWESICMRCGKCCMLKYSSGNVIHFSNRMCEHFDLKNGRCSCYSTRLSDSCVKVDLELLENNIELLPDTCAYRLLYEGKDLPCYHPLITGDKNSPLKAGATVKSLPVYSKSEYEESYNTLLKRQREEYWDADKAIKEGHKWLKKYKIRSVLSFTCPKKLNSKKSPN